MEHFSTSEFSEVHSNIYRENALITKGKKSNTKA